MKAAIRWLRLNAAKYGIDPARAVTWGESAGAHLAALAAVSCRAPGLEPEEAIKSGAGATPDIALVDVSDCVQGAVSWFGVFDIATITDQARKTKALSRDLPEAPEWRLLGCFAAKCRRKQIAAASPASYVDPSDPPMLLIAGSEDTIVPHRQTLAMAEKLRSAGVKHELIVLAGVGHHFLGKTLEQTRDANLKALEATFRFIEQTTGNVSAANR